MKKVRVNITRKCNIKCAYCYLKPSNHMMDTETFSNILTRTKPDRVTLSGGEPFLHPLLFDFMEMAVRSEASVNVVSNGTLIKRNLSRLSNLRTSLLRSDQSITFSISLDGTTKCEMASIAQLVNLGYKLQVYVYPFDTDVASIMQQINNLPKVDSIQILFPVSLGRNAESRIFKKHWLDFVDSFQEACGRLNSRVYLQYGFSDGEAPEACGQGGFYDCDGTEYNCCLLAEVISNGYRLPYPVCRVHEGQGCLALLTVHGEDYRLAEDPLAPCPIYTVKEVLSHDGKSH
ncbi:radical SAM protein [Paenibacillus oralis]|uniref:radical SAM protein n=1 Tax=Paenibacillus oralis TaxID=2490856 RepID=UPI0015AC1EF2|nr:radical SAM protein [Paenibacillus oralis]